MLRSRRVQKAPLLVLNIARVGAHDIPKDAADISLEFGADVKRELTWRLRRFGPKGREEKILIISRPAEPVVLSNA
jgi:hypothetical protein